VFYIAKLYQTKLILILKIEIVVIASPVYRTKQSSKNGLIAFWLENGCHFQAEPHATLVCGTKAYAKAFVHIAKPIKIDSAIRPFKCEFIQ
jgi:hypothetical protein